MTCSSCGTVFAQDAHFCPHCGTPVVQQPQPSPLYPGYPAVLPYTRVSRHLQVAGILWIVYAFERTASKLVGLMFLHGIFGSHFNADWKQLGTAGQLWLRDDLAGRCRVADRGPRAEPADRLRTAHQTALGTRDRHRDQHTGAVPSDLRTALGIYTLWLLAPAASGDEYAAITAATPR